MDKLYIIRYYTEIKVFNLPPVSFSYCAQLCVSHFLLVPP